MSTTRTQRLAIAAVALVLAVVTAMVRGTDLRLPIVPAPGYRHDRFQTMPKDIFREFRAYVTSFDSDDDNNGDGAGDAWAIPEWVSYELRAAPDPMPAASGGVSPWITDDDLFADEVAPDDDSYLHSGFSRGHMCMRSHAQRLGTDADFNTHIVFNACPQDQTMNNGAWKALENKTGAWADHFGAVWIVCGPIILGQTPSRFIGDPGEVPVAVPDAFFKIVVKESSAPDRPDVLAFIIPMHGVGNFNSSNHDVTPYLTSVDVIEALTGLEFLTSLDDAVEVELERVVHNELWPEG